MSTIFDHWSTTFVHSIDYNNDYVFENWKEKIKFLHFIMGYVPDYFHHFSQHQYVDQVLTKFTLDVEQMYLLPQTVLDIL